MTRDAEARRLSLGETYAGADTIRRVLIVDDHDTARAGFACLLDAPPACEDQALAELAVGAPGATADGLPRYQVSHARSGDAAVHVAAAAAAAGAPFGVAFVDVQVPPGLEGVEVAARLWQVQPDLEVVLCTASSDCAWRAITARLPWLDQLVILRKPFDPIEVRQLAACLTEKHRRGRVLAHRVLTLEARAAKSARMQVELERTQKFDALGRLSAGIAHEINTPTQYIQSSLEFLGDAFGELTAVIDAQRAQIATLGGEPPEAPMLAELLTEVPRALTDARDGLRRVAAIVRSVRDYAHPGRSRHDAVDLNRQIRTAVELARNEYKHDADLVLDLGALPPVTGNADELGCAILNLIINAAQAVHAAPRSARGRIEITSRATADRVTIDIADTGIGISPEHRERVFEPFFTTKAVGQGTGQGLAIARATIVDGHRGSLTFESEPGRGTVFHLSVPIAAAEAAS